jgi:hypothetical protein
VLRGLRRRAGRLAVLLQRLRCLRLLLRGLRRLLRWVRRRLRQRMLLAASLDFRIPRSIFSCHFSIAYLNRLLSAPS